MGGKEHAGLEADSEEISEGKAAQRGEIISLSACHH
jgi:hypothetical protein